MPQKLDLTLLRVAAGIIVYLAMLGPITIATYVLWAGPRRLDAIQSWPLEFYFVVSNLATMLVGSGIVAVIRAGPGLIRRVF